MELHVLLTFALASVATCESAGDRLLLGTDGRGMLIFTPSPPGIRQITRTQSGDAVAYDAITGRAYWSDDSTKLIYRSDLEGKEIEQLYPVQRSHTVRAIEMDAASRNLYIVLYNRTASITEMSICNVDSNMCAQIEHNLFDNAYGLALHPQKGHIYWTNRFSSSSGEIIRAFLDGSSSFPIVSGLYSPGGLTIDHQESRLYWTSGSSTQPIQSCDLNGSDLKNVVVLPYSTSAFGIAIIGDIIYWSRHSSNGGVESCNKSNCVGQWVFNASTPVNHIAAISPVMSRTLRFDQCADAMCSHVCVLKGTSYKCMCPAGTKLGRNGKTCV